MAGLAEIAQKLDRRRRASDLSIAAMGARGESGDVKKLIKDWSQ